MFEELSGAFEEDAEAPDLRPATQRGLIPEANKLTEALERLRGGEQGICEGMWATDPTGPAGSHPGSHNLPPMSGPPGALSTSTPSRPASGTLM